LAWKRILTTRCKSLLQLAGALNHYYAAVAVAQPPSVRARQPNELPLLVLLRRVAKAHSLVRNSEQKSF
jgi:hypothetical protein